MKDTVISFDTAKLANEKGFDIKTGSLDYMVDGNHSGKIGACISCTSYVKAPTQSLLQKWLREQDTPIIVTPITDFVAWQVEIQHPEKGLSVFCQNNTGKWLNSYEESLEYGLRMALNLI